MLPVTQISSPPGPSGQPFPLHRLRMSSAVRRILGSDRVIPRSASTIADQLVTEYFGTYSEPPEVRGVTQWPSGHWESSNQAAQPLRPSWRRAARTRGSLAERPSTSSQYRRRTLGSASEDVSHLRTGDETCVPCPIRPNGKPLRLGESGPERLPRTSRGGRLVVSDARSALFPGRSRSGVDGAPVARPAATAVDRSVRRIREGLRPRRRTGDRAPEGGIARGPRERPEVDRRRPGPVDLEPEASESGPRSDGASLSSVAPIGSFAREALKSERALGARRYEALAAGPGCRQPHAGGSCRAVHKVPPRSGPTEVGFPEDAASRPYASGGVVFTGGRWRNRPVADGGCSVCECFPPCGLRRSAGGRLTLRPRAGRRLRLLSYAAGDRHRRFSPNVPEVPFVAPPQSSGVRRERGPQASPSARASSTRSAGSSDLVHFPRASGGAPEAPIRFRRRACIDRSAQA